MTPRKHPVVSPKGIVRFIRNTLGHSLAPGLVLGVKTIAGCHARLSASSWAPAARAVPPALTSAPAFHSRVEFNGENCSGLVVGVQEKTTSTKTKKQNKHLWVVDPQEKMQTERKGTTGCLGC